MPDLHVPMAVLMEALSAPEREAWERALADAPPVEYDRQAEADTLMAAMLRALFEAEQERWQEFLEQDEAVPARAPSLARAA